MVIMMVFGDLFFVPMMCRQCDKYKDTEEACYKCKKLKNFEPQT